MIGTTEEALADVPVCLAAGQVTAPLEAWHRFEVGDHHALNDVHLGVVVAGLGCLAGQRLGLGWDAPVHLGDWLCGLIMGWLLTHGNDAQLWQLEGIAAQAVSGGFQYIGPATYNPDVWDVYRPAVTAVVRALREGIQAPLLRSFS